MNISHPLRTQAGAQLQPWNLAQFFSDIHWISDTCVSLCFSCGFNSRKCGAETKPLLGCDGRTVNINLILLQTNRNMKCMNYSCCDAVCLRTFLMDLFMTWFERQKDKARQFVKTWWNRRSSSAFWQLLWCARALRGNHATALNRNAWRPPSLLLISIFLFFKIFYWGTWVAQWLSICLWLRVWSEGPETEPHIRLLAVRLLFPLPVSLPLSVPLMNK